MGEMADDRIYADRRGKTRVLVGSDLGVTLVETSDDRVGRFRLVRRGQVDAIAAGDGRAVIGTDEAVHLAADGDIETFEALGFGPAVAVGTDGPVAAAPDGTVARHEAGEWRTLGTVEDPAAIDGEWIAAGDGLYRIGEDSLERRGPPARDVADGSVPIAATDDGIVRYADGEWTIERRGTFHAVASRGPEAHAVGETGLSEHRDGEWVERPVPTDERIVALGYGQGPIAITAAGTILVDPPAAKDGATGWRSRSLGLASVTGLAVADGPT